MRKTKIIAPVILSVSIGLVGCGANQDETADQNKMNATKSIGYYSNEQEDTNNSGDNDGPVTEIMDHTLGEEGRNGGLQVRNVNNENNNDTNKENDSKKIDANLANKIANTVKNVDNVKDAETLVYGDQVLVALEVNNSDDIKKTKAAVEDKIDNNLKNKDITVVTDRGMFTNIEDINKSIRNGKTERTITNNIENMLHHLDPTNSN